MQETFSCQGFRGVPILFEFPRVWGNKVVDSNIVTDYVGAYCNMPFLDCPIKSGNDGCEVSFRRILPWNLLLEGPSLGEQGGWIINRPARRCVEVQEVPPDGVLGVSP